jgi:hypothetical protein
MNARARGLPQFHDPPPRRERAKRVRQWSGPVAHRMIRIPTTLTPTACCLARRGFDSTPVPRSGHPPMHAVTTCCCSGARRSLPPPSPIRTSSRRAPVVQSEFHCFSDMREGGTLSDSVRGTGGGVLKHLYGSRRRGDG